MQSRTGLAGSGQQWHRPPVCCPQTIAPASTLPAARDARRSASGALAGKPTSLAVANTLAAKPRLVYVGSLGADGMCPDKTLWGEQVLAEAPLTPPRISKDADHFANMGLEFVTARDNINLRDLNELFEKVGFPKRDPTKLKIAIENTYHLIWIRSTKQSRLARMGQMIGFARATSDGVLSATIWDVAILPAWQRCGLGRALMERLTARLVEDGIPTITLYAEPNVVQLYEKLGFMKDPEGIRGMAFQRKKKESLRQKSLVSA